MSPKQTSDGPANEAQCFFCFEVLSAKFGKRTPPSLAKVTQLWQEWQQGSVNSKNSEHEAQVSVPQGSNVSPESNAMVVSSPGSSSSAINTSSTSNSASSSISTYSAHDSYPVYVTWNTLNPSSKRYPKSLRGCIGTFEAMPLEDGLSTYTLVSALEDYRFTPIEANLIPSLGVELTLLGTFEPCSDVLDWQIGKHGLRIGFSWQGKRLGATYLPHVCPEQGWTKEECLKSLMEKAGWAPGRHETGSRWFNSGASSANTPGNEGKPWETVTGMKVTRYTGFHTEASYAEWRAWREWVGERL